MDLLLNLTEVVRQFKLFDTSDKILKNYAALHPQSFSEIEEKYPKLWAMVGEFDFGKNLELNVVNLVYSQKGSYRAVDLLSKILGFKIYIYGKDDHDNDILLNNPENDPDQTYHNPIKVTDVIVDELPAELYYRISANLVSVLRDLIWEVDKDLEVTTVTVHAEFEIHQWDTYDYKMTSINNIIISEEEV